MYPRAAMQYSLRISLYLPKIATWKVRDRKSNLTQSLRKKSYQFFNSKSFLDHIGLRLESFQSACAMKLGFYEVLHFVVQIWSWNFFCSSFWTRERARVYPRVHFLFALTYIFYWQSSNVCLVISSSCQIKRTAL